MTNSTPTQFGGYALTSVRSHEGRDGLAFTATITKDGKKVILVRNEGCGGCNFCDMVGPFKTTEDMKKALPAYQRALAEFEAFAKEWNAGNEFAGFEDGDALVDHLIEVATLNKKRTVLFVMDEADYFNGDPARGFGASVTYDQAVSYLTKTYPGRNVRVWNKDRSEFVAID